MLCVVRENFKKTIVSGILEFQIGTDQKPFREDCVFASETDNFKFKSKSFFYIDYIRVKRDPRYGYKRGKNILELLNNR